MMVTRCRAAALTKSRNHRSPASLVNNFQSLQQQIIIHNYRWPLYSRVTHTHTHTHTLTHSQHTHWHTDTHGSNQQVTQVSAKSTKYYSIWWIAIELIQSRLMVMEKNGVVWKRRVIEMHLGRAAGSVQLAFGSSWRSVGFRGCGPSGVKVSHGRHGNTQQGPLPW